MKYLLLIALILFLFLISSCVGVPLPSVAANATAVAQTLTALSWTAMPSATFNAYIPTMIQWMNNDLSAMSPLGRTLDADYHVIDISFRNLPNKTTMTFRVDVNCLCMNGDECCLPERTFVVILETMYRNSNTALVQVPVGVGEIMVVCMNQQTKTQVGAVSASWQDVDAYLRRQLSGDQLGVRAIRTLAP